MSTKRQRLAEWVNSAAYRNSPGGEGEVGSLGQTCTLVAVFNTDHQQGPAAERREVCSLLGGSLAGRGVWGRMDACMCVPGSLPCSPETITTLLISYTLFYSYTR